jgi:hypothetical protein
LKDKDYVEKLKENHETSVEDKMKFKLHAKVQFKLIEQFKEYTNKQNMEFMEQ